MSKKPTPNQRLARLKAGPAILRERSLTLRERVAQQATEAVDMLQRTVRGELDPPPTRVKAAQILLDRCLPVMSQSEVTTSSPYDSMTPEQLLALLHDKLSALPAVNTLPAQLIPGSVEH